MVRGNAQRGRDNVLSIGLICKFRRKNRVYNDYFAFIPVKFLAISDLKSIKNEEWIQRLPCESGC